VQNHNSPANNNNSNMMFYDLNHIRWIEPNKRLQPQAPLQSTQADFSSYISNGILQEQPKSKDALEAD
jgi:hypothetical protein